MDKSLDDIVARAVLRGNRYVKGEVALPLLHSKIAELGVFLLEKSKNLKDASPEAIRAELIEIQNKIDDLRKNVFSNKRLV